MSGHKRRHSISSSSEEDRVDDSKYKKELLQKENRIGALEGLVRQLRQTQNYFTSQPTTSYERDIITSTPKTHLNDTTVRYLGRSDIVPEFDPERTTISIEHWIRNLESIASMYGWDERTLICNCTSKLRGYAKGWYERQQSFDVSWEEWKDRLKRAFPFTQNKLNLIRELVNRVRPAGEDPIKFFYDKLGIGMTCGMSDEVIAEAIIGTLGDKLMEVGAVSAGCRSSCTLLKYLGTIKSVEQTQTVHSVTDTRVSVSCFNCGKSGHKARACAIKMSKGKDEKKIICRFCNQAGHIESNCFKKRKQNKFCSYCKRKGHNFEDCWKRRQDGSKSESKDSYVKKVQVLCPEKSDEKYYKQVLVNNNMVNGYIDFGSACNTMKESIRQKCNLEFTGKDCEVVIRGYGDALTVPLGMVSASLTVDGVERDTEFFVVPDKTQMMDILVGQPFTEAINVVVVKTPTKLTIFDSDLTLELPDLCENLARIKIYPSEDKVIVPGLNKVVATTEPSISGVMKLELREHRCPKYEMDVLGDMINSEDGGVTVRVVNRTTENITLNHDRCFARGTLSDIGVSNPRIGEKLSAEEKLALEDVLQQYDHCFTGDGIELGQCDVEMSIKLTQDKMIYYRPYRLSYHERQIVQKIVSDLLKAGIIEESKSPYASPILLVRKKDGGYRMCVDYRALNKITEKERYPMPVIQDLLDRLVDKSVFSCLDLANGYHQIRISSASRPLTAFVTPDGQYQYRMMSFGLCNAPAVFQRAMNEILAPVLHRCAEVYIDDVIIWGDNVSDALENLRKVLALISEAGVKLKKSKCSFLTESVEYLGHKITKGEIRPSPEKILAVQDFGTPKNVHEVRQFLGLASYFRKFIKGFAITAQPLTKLTKKDQEWIWSEEQSKAMETLKESLVTDPVLAIYSPDRVTQLHTDASKIGLGGVLLQRQNDNTFKVVAYASRQTSATEQNYHSFELEALAVVFSIQKFRVYLTGIKFEVVTDCAALRLAWSKKDLSPRIARWWLDLQEYNFVVEHRPGTAMSHVDALSRNPINLNHIEERDLIDALQDGDESIQSLIENLNLELVANKNKKDGLAKQYKIVGERIHRIVDNGTRPVLPKNARWHILKVYHDNHGHLGVEKCLEAIKAKYWFAKMRQFVEKYVNSCIGCQFTKKPTGKQPGLLHPIPRAMTPFETLHIDHLGPFCNSGGKQYIVAIIDGFTKFVWLEAVKSANAKGAIQALQRFAQVFGYPNRIISDRGTAFTGKEFKEFVNEHGIKHVQNAVASPRANGQVERLNRTILSSLTAHMGEEQKGWEVYLPQVQLGVNSTVSQGTGKSPLELLCGLQPRLSAELQGPVSCQGSVEKARQEAAESIKRNALKMKTRFDRSRRASKGFSVGDLVMVERKIMRSGIASGKLVPRYAGPYKVTEVLPHDRYEVTSANKGKRGYKNVVACDKIKRWHAREFSSDEG